MDLHISKRLDIFDKHETADKLEAQILADGKVLESIKVWNDGKRFVIVDGVHRFKIAQKHDLKFKTEEMHFDSYDAAKEWMWNFQSSRRNLTREQIGQWYNQMKARQGGDRSKVSNDTLVSTSGGSASEYVSGKTGVSESTVKRAGARVEAIQKLTKPAQAVAEKATDAEVKSLAKLDSAGQTKVARAIRTGQAESVKEAIKVTGAKPAKPDYGKCPNCAGTKWDEDDEGVSCSKCGHPHGEPAGTVDEDFVTTQKAKTRKTCEALQRAFDDLQAIQAKEFHSGLRKWSAADVKTTLEDMGVVQACKGLLAIAKQW